jgi:ATP adenylyltransferase
MNKYPYNSGHLLICTNRHVPLYDEMTAQETHEMADLTAQAMRTLRKVAKAEGFNIGLNQGSVAGAGVAGHIHQHIVPRWAGDINFMPIVGGTKVLPELLEQTRLLLSKNWCD